MSYPLIFIIALLICWLISPFGMIIVGWIFEDRMVPLWRHQFRSYIPGDFFLGVGVASMFTASVHPHEHIPLDFIAPWVAGVAAVVLAVFWRKMEAKAYSPRALNSPTKKYHDYGLFGAYGYIGFTVLLMAVSALLSQPASVWPWFVVGAVGGLIWLGCAVYDGFKSAGKAQYAHVEDYHAVWQR